MHRHLLNFKSFLLSLILFAHPISIFAQDSSFFRIIDSKHFNFDYSYAPTIIKENGRYHIFFCSQANTDIAPGAWDFIRHTTSTDGINWSSPNTKLIAMPHVNPATGLNVDYAACDPSIVYFQGYYYLYYSNSVQTSPANWIINQTQVSVARSTSLDGEYLTYTQRGTWEKTPTDPAYIISPTIFRSVQFQGYGAGQQSVVAIGDTLYLWYRDDSDNPDITSVISTYLVKSTNPVVWDTTKRQRISVEDAYSVDIKYDSVNQQFIMPRMANMHTANSYFDLTFSTDGVNWNNRKTIIPKEQFTPFGHNPGFQSDKYGHLQPGSKIFAFGAPPNLAKTDTFGLWDLYGVKTLDVPPFFSLDHAIQNPGFETGNTTGWWMGNSSGTISNIPPTVKSGQASLKLAQPNSIVYQDVDGLTHGQKYTVTVQVVGDLGTTANAKLWLHDATGANLSPITQKIPSTSFSPLSAEFTATPNQTLRIHLGSDGGSGAIYFDDLTLTQGSVTNSKSGDLNADGHVNLFDFNLLVRKYGNPYTIFDFNAIVSNYGK